MVFVEFRYTFYNTVFVMCAVQANGSLYGKKKPFVFNQRSKWLVAFANRALFL